MSGELIRYDAMCRAISEARRIDEAKDIRDKARALEEYARQANNEEAERECREIRVRAERQCGALLRETDKAKGARGTGSNQYQVRSDETRAPSPKTLKDYGLSYDQSSQFQKLADIPEDVFERELKAQDMPSAASIVFAHAPPSAPPVSPVSAGALWLWGRLRDFEHDGLLGEDPACILRTMTDSMIADVLRLAPTVSLWLSNIGQKED